MKLEIASHCWQYSRLLRYQLSSLLLYPPGPGVEVLMTVVLSPEDAETVELVRHFRSLPAPPNVTVRPWPMPKGQLFLREVGRNQVALTTDADWVWFADCDYLFRSGCLDALAAAAGAADGPLVFPKECWVNRTHELGDAAIERSTAQAGLLDVDAADFTPKGNSRAVGGIQIARGEVLRRLGYCNSPRRQTATARRWRRTHSDVAFRRSLGTRGTGLEVPNVFRIRHTEKGRFNAAAKL